MGWLSWALVWIVAAVLLAWGIGYVIRAGRGYEDDPWDVGDDE